VYLPQFLAGATGNVPVHLSRIEISYILADHVSLFSMASLSDVSIRPFYAPSTQRWLGEP
jgi:hypothetical protein